MVEARPAPAAEEDEPSETPAPVDDAVQAVEAVAVGDEVETVVDATVADEAAPEDLAAATEAPVVPTAELVTAEAAGLAQTGPESRTLSTLARGALILVGFGASLLIARRQLARD
ncbi:hypothetical protein GCM10025865_14230 [Paraoerskovia sediminicola]|uniref:Gram-positive cocci surface proteins LPxTG domain-containing protein n=1 Tax=Paraoerskovia sediminicola TaxID=1138587 RepID=A0ABM8G1Y8_9CELL|nr:hypothetical protein [Paraoerskovia sediminicola]BDZ42124.1 hypothetical protein GCM10025865_14230 [Paraoerskovia sediminicola]